MGIICFHNYRKRWIGIAVVLILTIITIFSLPYTTVEAKSSGIVSRTDSKYSYSDMKKDLQQLKKKYSDFLEVSVIGKTADQRNIYCVEVGNLDTGKKKAEKADSKDQKTKKKDTKEQKTKEADTKEEATEDTDSKGKNSKKTDAKEQKTKETATEGKNAGEAGTGKTSDFHTLVIAGVHAREYINCQVAMVMIETYCQRLEKDPSSLAKYGTICFVPMVNPDGVTISQYGIKKIRNKKLRSKLKKWVKASGSGQWKANARGVDINRNFPVGWNNWKERSETLARHAGFQKYPGKKAASEKETQAILSLTETIRPKAVINLHSMGECIYYGSKKPVSKKEKKLLQMVKRETGYEPVQEQVSQPYGCAENYFIDRKIPEVCIETGHGGAPVSHGQFETILRKTIEIPWKAAKLWK